MAATRVRGKCSVCALASSSIPAKRRAAGACCVSGTSESREALLTLLESTYFGNRDGLGPLVEALDDADVRWRRAVHHALRFASGEDLGYDPEADAGVRREAQVRWRAWWEAKSGAVTSAP